MIYWRIFNLTAVLCLRLPEGGVLLLCGDHGMTDGGEHGGASPEETDAGLFVYRKPLRDEPQSGVGAPSKTLRAPPMISQVEDTSDTCLMSALMICCVDMTFCRSILCPP